MKQLLTILFILISITVNANTYYVSNSGDDSKSGLTTVLAWQTLSKVNSFPFSPGDNILFERGGVFYGKLIISQSGSSGNPITYGTYGFGDNPVITGFTDVTSWTNLGSNIWQSTSAVSALSTCNMVSVNSINTPMGRTPNTGWSVYQTYSTNTSITSSSLTGTPDWTGAQVVIKKFRYVIEKHPITSQSGGTLNYSGGGSNGQNNWGFFIQNDARTLDQQNEWYYNPSNGKLSIYSTSSPTGVSISTVDTLVYVVNKNYITFDGITFTGANGQAFYLGNAAHLTIKNCDFSFNYYAILGKQFGGSSSNLLVDSCTFSQTNNNAIDLPSEFSGATITNNFIQNTGRYEGMAGSGQSRWGMSLTGNNYLVQYNEVDSTGYVGIGLNGSNLTCANNIVNYFCSITDDGGGIYTGNPQTGVVISDNIVLNGIGNDEGTGSTNSGAAYGIYCDDNSSGMTILNNSVANMINAAIFLHNSKDIIVRGNTTFNSRVGLFVSADDNTKHTTGLDVKGNTFIANTTGTMYTPQDQYALWLASYFSDLPSFGNIDSNYYARPINDNLTIIGTKYGAIDTKYSLGTWIAAFGYDTHSFKSPRAISNLAQLGFYYNDTSSDSTLNLGGSVYVDMANTSYTGNVVLPAYSSLVLINTGTLITPTITWANPSAITYGIALSSTQLNASTTVAGTFSYNYPSGIILNAGTYTLTTTFTPTDGTTYSTATKSVTLTVNKGTATLSYSGLTKTYNGLPQSPTIISSPTGLTVINTTFNNVGAIPVNAGSYTVVSGLTNPNYSATNITNTFVINKATATITVTSNLNQIADGNSKPISATTNPLGLSLTITYDGSPTAPSAAGSYAVHIEVVNGNYSGSKDVTLEITAPSAAITITNLLQTYDGTPKSVTITTIPSSLPYDITYNGSAVSSVTNAGDYTVIATLNDGVHTGADTATLVIQKANPVLTWANPQPVQAGTQLSSTQLNATSNIAGNFVYSSPLGTSVTEGVLPITATFTPSNGNYNTGAISILLNVYENPITNFIIGDFYENK